MNLIWNENCLNAKNRIIDNSIDLLICDPPFGINEGSFDKHYNRKDNVVDGYIEAPEDYYQFSLDWIREANRVIKENGSLYIISGWTNLKDVLIAVEETEFKLINHIIWKYNFGVYTKKKYVSSHYHILYLSKGKPYFNTYCRFGPNERDDKGSLNYRDLEDVFIINKEYSPGEVKNQNKLPDELIKKLILYSSKEGDLVGDFFLGNFTTAIVAKQLGRQQTGFEINTSAYQLGIQRLEDVVFGEGLHKLKKVTVSLPENQGKRVTEMEAAAIKSDFLELIKVKTKKESIEELSLKYGRGRFSITNILKN